MPVLAYAVAAGPVDTGVAGICDTRVVRDEVDGLYVWYSDVPSMADDLPANALRFHAVAGDLFRQATIIPFRFPTLLPSKTELEDFIRFHRGAFAADLKRLAGTVQMDVTVAVTAAPGAHSGTDYLEQRRERRRLLHDAVQQIRTAVGGLTLATAEREIIDGIRLFFLLSRDHRDRFIQAVAQSGVRGLRTTGPWPPTAFLSKELVAANG
jgi:hypothetical protein